MSADLSNTVGLLSDAAFVSRVKAAATEQAKAAIVNPPADWRDRMASDRLAMAVVYDAEQAAKVLARLCADDVTISGVPVPGDVPDGEIRRVVEAHWLSVAASMPGL